MNALNVVRRSISFWPEWFGYVMWMVYIILMAIGFMFGLYDWTNEIITSIMTILLPYTVDIEFIILAQIVFLCFIPQTYFE